MSVRSEPVRVAVLASGSGTNLQALVDHFHARADAPARVVLVVANRPGIRALERAVAAGVTAATLPPGGSGAAELLDLLDEHGTELIVLAGYLQLLPPEVLARYPDRILNIHPALLPGFGGAGMYGMHVHRAVLEAGVKVSGATVHLVDEAYDEGRIVAQWPVPVLPGDTPETLAARVLRVEHLLLPAVVEAFATGAAREAVGDPLAFTLSAASVPDTLSLQSLISPFV